MTRQPPIRRTPARDSAVRAYEQLKQQWSAKNPAATPKEYEAAMREITRRLGV